MARESPNLAPNATFVTLSPPDVERNAIFIGICTVPFGREGMNDLGWHVADFLAFRALFGPYLNPRSQAWLSHVDVISAAKKNRYTHSGRNLTASSQSEDVQISVEPSAPKLAAKIISCVSSRAQQAKEDGDHLVIVVCGPTSLEQDIFFGDDEYKVTVTSEQILAVIDPDVNVIFVTPSLTSAGWQVNPSFTSSHTNGTSNDARVSPLDRPIDFMARQCGAIFASRIVPYLLDWNSPLIKQPADTSQFPVVMTAAQQQARGNLEMTIHSLLAGRMSNGHRTHMFSFDAQNDEWETLFSRRKGQSLSKMAQKWHGDQADTNGVSSTNTSPGFYFLGSTFGGSKESQAIHIKHMIKESFHSWPGYYLTPFGQLLRKELDGFLHGSPDDLDFHAMFNIMENRTTLMVLGDLVTKNFNIAPIFNARCRDWDEARWSKLVTEAERALTSRLFGDIHRHIPPICLPAGRNLNMLCKAHTLVTRASQYIAAALTVRFRQDTPHLESAAKDVINLLHQIHDRQIQLLMENRDVQARADVWFGSIGIPLQNFDGSHIPTKPQKLTHTRSAAIEIRRPPESPSVEIGPPSTSTVSNGRLNLPVNEAAVHHHSPIKEEETLSGEGGSSDKDIIPGATKRDVQFRADAMPKSIEPTKQAPTTLIEKNSGSPAFSPAKPIAASHLATENSIQQQPMPDTEEDVPPHLRKKFIRPLTKQTSSPAYVMSGMAQEKLGSSQGNAWKLKSDVPRGDSPQKLEPDPEAHLAPHLRKIFRFRSQV